MKRTKFAILLFLGIGLCSFAQRQGNASFEIIENDLHEFSFHIRIRNVDTVNTDGYVRLFVDETFATGFDSGEPELPVLYKIIAVPENATPKLVFSDNGVRNISLSRKIFPIPPHCFKKRNQGESCMNPKIYESAEVYKNDLVKVSEMGVFRNLRLYRITVSPLEYNPSKNELLLHEDISVVVKFDGADYEATMKQLRRTCGVYNFSGVANKSAYENLLARNIAAPRHVIVTLDTFRNALLEFAQWKRQIGFDVEFMSVAQDFTPDSIRECLKNKYLNATPLNPAPVFVTIVGDTNHIGTFPGKVNVQGIGTHNTDLYFGEYTGDYYPDALVGRISVADTVELRHVLQKILNYEKYLLQDTDYLKRVIMVAGQEARTPAPTTTNGAVNYLKDNCFVRNAGFDTICFYNPESGSLLGEIVPEISQGASLLYYTAHGDRNGWLRPNFNSTIADTLQNRGKCFLAVNNCCLSSSFSEAACFGEKLLRLHDAGAIGVIGATNETLWDEDYYWSVGAKYPFSLAPQYDSARLGCFDRLMHVHGEDDVSSVATQAQMIHAGNFAVAQSGSPYENYYWEIYNLLGDPSTMPYVGVPRKMSAVMPDSLPLGTSRVNLRGTPFSRISVLQDTVLQLSATFDGSGNLVGDFLQPIGSGDLLVTSTAQFHQPRTDTVKIYTSDHPKLIINNLSLRNVPRNGSLVAGKSYDVDVEFLNAGSDTSKNAALLAWSHDGKCRVSVNSLLTDTVLPQGRLSAQNVATISVNPNVADGDVLQITFSITEDNNTTFEHTYSFVVENSVLESGAAEFRKNGSIAKVLQKDSVYTMRVPVVNSGKQISDTLQVVLNLDAMTAQHASRDSFMLLPIMPRQADTAEFMVRIIDVAKNRLESEICICDADTTLCHSDVYPLNRATEDFETGDFAQFSWDTTYVNSWVVDTATVHGGRFSARSPQIHDRQRGMLQITLDVLADDTISFYSKVSCERGADYLYFYIDGNRQGIWTGDLDWQESSFPVLRGRHTFLWKYEKDDSRSERSDCAWIDDVVFPFSRLDSSYTPQQVDGIAVAETGGVEFKMFPNPVKNVLTVENLENEEFELCLYTVLGQMVDKITVKPHETIYYETSNLRFGTYILTIKNQKRLSVEKITVAK